MSKINKLQLLSSLFVISRSPVRIRVSALFSNEKRHSEQVLNTSWSAFFYFAGNNCSLFVAKFLHGRVARLVSPFLAGRAFFICGADETILPR